MVGNISHMKHPGLRSPRRVLHQIPVSVFCHSIRLYFHEDFGGNDVWWSKCGWI